MSGDRLVLQYRWMDCFPAEQLAEIVVRLMAAATPDAHWLLADSCESAPGLAKWRARSVLRAM